MHKIWNVKPHQPEAQATLTQELNIHSIVAQLLINRDIIDVKEAREFLFCEPSHTHDPFLLKGMQALVDRIYQARDKGETVLIYGDYDVDGVTSSAILTRLLDKLGINVINYIPHRMSEGYGLNHEVADFAAEKNVDLLITVDCGITSVEEVNTLNAKNIEVIIIDHHMPDQKLPEAVAIVNPKQGDCPYPFKDLATVGLVTKIAQALFGEFPEGIIDLTALGTVADIVPLRGENRIFVKYGLPKIEQTKNMGLAALLDVAKIKGKKITPYSIGFILGPRINAMGRMDSALKSLELFLTRDQSQALELAQLLDKHNSDRQKMQREVADEALSMVDAQMLEDQSKVLVVSKEGWHKGVLGIVASRITDKYYRPSVVISVQDGVGTASCRSVDGFHLHEALSECSDCLEAFGGHQGAAGLTIKSENIDPFRSLINNVAQEVLEPQKLQPTLTIDCEVPLSHLDLHLANIIDSMQPFGEGNPQPVLCSRNLTVIGRPAVLGKGTLKFWVTDGLATISAVGFGMAPLKEMVEEGKPLDLAYNLSIDDWNKAPTPQLILKDIKLSEE